MGRFSPIIVLYCRSYLNDVGYTIHTILYQYAFVIKWNTFIFRSFVTVTPASQKIDTTLIIFCMAVSYAFIKSLRLDICMSYTVIISLRCTTVWRGYQMHAVSSNYISRKIRELKLSKVLVRNAPDPDRDSTSHKLDI